MTPTKLMGKSSMKHSPSLLFDILTQEDDEEEVKERLQLAADDFASKSQQFGKCAVDYDDDDTISRPSPVLFSSKAKPVLTAAERRKSLQSEAGLCSTVKGDERTSSLDLSQITPTFILQELLGELFIHPDRLIKSGNYGMGGFATVHKCSLLEPSGLKVMVAVKQLLPEVLKGADDLRDFLAEANLLRKMRHPNIVAIKGIGSFDLTSLDGMRRNMYVVMEAMTGGSLKMAVLRQQLASSSAPVYGPRDALRWSLHTAAGMQYIHDICKPMIIHRDMKLDNLLLSGGGTDQSIAKLADFGLHKRAEKSTEGGQIREAGVSKYKWTSQKTGPNLGEKFFGAGGPSKSSSQKKVSAPEAATPTSAAMVSATHNYANEQSYYGGAAYYNLLPGKANPSTKGGNKGTLSPSTSAQNLVGLAGSNGVAADGKQGNNTTDPSPRTSLQNRLLNNSGSGSGGSAHGGRKSPTFPPPRGPTVPQNMMGKKMTPLPLQPPFSGFHNGSNDRGSATPPANATGAFQNVPEPINAATARPYTPFTDLASIQQDADSAYAASFAAASQPVHNSIIYMASLTPPGPLTPATTAAALFNDMTLDEQRRIEHSVQPFLESPVPTNGAGQPASSLLGSTLLGYRTKSGQFSPDDLTSGGSRHGPSPGGSRHGMGPGENMLAHTVGNGGEINATSDGHDESVRRKMLALHVLQRHDGQSTRSSFANNAGGSRDGTTHSQELNDPSPSAAAAANLINQNSNQNSNSLQMQQQLLLSSLFPNTAVIPPLSLSEKVAAAGGGGVLGGLSGFGSEGSRKGAGAGGRASLSMAAIKEDRAAGRQSMEIGIGHRQGGVGSSPYMQAAAEAAAAAASMSSGGRSSGAGRIEPVDEATVSNDGGSGPGSRGVQYPKLSTMSLHCGPKLKDATTQVGSFMYMAPELLLGQDYNEKIDVFSFAIIMYEMFVGRLLALKSEIISGGTEGVEAYTKERSLGAREHLPESWPLPLRQLISECWAQEPDDRPGFKEIYASLDRMTKDDALASMCKVEESVGCSCCIS